MIALLFSRLKYLPSLFEKSGVYEVKCCNFIAAHVGQTGRKVGIRLSDSENALSNTEPGKSYFAAHLVLNDHSFIRERDLCLSNWLKIGRRLTALEN